MTPSPAENRISPPLSREPPPVRPEEPDDAAQVRLAHGRVGGRSGELALRRSPSGVPAPVKLACWLPARQGGRSASIASRTRSVNSFAEAIVAGPRSTGMASPTITRTRGNRTRGARAQRSSGGDDRTGTMGAPVARASRAAPRCQLRWPPPRIVPCGNTTTASPTSSARAPPRRPPCRLCPVRPESHRADEGRVPAARRPELVLRQVSERTVDRGGEEEGIEEGLVVGDDDHGAGRNPLGPLRTEPPDAPGAPGSRSRGRTRRPAPSAVRPRARPDHTRRLLSRRAYPSGVPWIRSPGEQRALVRDDRRPVHEANIRVRGAGLHEHVVESGSRRSVPDDRRPHPAPVGADELRSPRRHVPGTPPRTRRDRSSQG